MKNIDFGEEIKALTGVRSFYQRSQDTRETVGAFFFSPPFCFTVIGAVAGIFIYKTGHNKSNRMDPIDEIKNIINEVNTKTKSLKNLSRWKNSISSCLSTIRSCPSHSHAYQFLIATVEKIKSKIDAELDAKSRTENAISCGVITKKLYEKKNISVLQPDISQIIISFAFNPNYPKKPAGAIDYNSDSATP